MQKFLSRLRAALRYYRTAKRLEREPPCHPLGFRFMGTRAMEAGEFEPEETAIMQRILGEFDLLINVGANVGYYCCLALQAGKKVVAFEPMPGNLQQLYKNIEINAWQDSIEVLPLALGERPGILKIYGQGTGASLVPGWAGARDYTLVPVSTLDLVLHDRFAGQRPLMLVDVEGAELGMLRGATRFLKRDPKPVWIVEVAIKEHQPQGVELNPHLLPTFELFWEAGYRSWTAERTPRVVERERILETIESGEDRLGTHNFVFCESLPESWRTS